MFEKLADTSPESPMLNAYVMALIYIRLIFSIFDSNEICAQLMFRSLEKRQSVCYISYLLVVYLVALGDIMVTVLAIGPKVCGFKAG
jgi:hypothetical protein